MAVPGSDILIADGPVDAVIKFLRSLKFVLAPALAGTPPDEGFAAYLEELVLVKGSIRIYRLKQDP